jgi:hypothetical protein
MYIKITEDTRQLIIADNLRGAKAVLQILDMTGTMRNQSLSQ